MYEKENKDYGYQIRTRTYSNLNSRNKGPEQEPIYEVRPRGGLTYNKKPAFLQSYQHSDEQQWSDKHDSNSPKAKGYVRQVPYHHHNSAKSSEEGSVSMYNRRQGSKKQELEMRMNNINCINDKIYSLLNMVKKQRVYESKQKVEQRPTRYAEPRSRSPINQTTVMQLRQKKQEIHEPKAQNIQQPAFSKAHNKSLQRLRALSTLEPNLKAKQARSRQKINYNQLQFNNQQDNENRERKMLSYSPYKANLYGSKQKPPKHDPYGQNTFQEPESNRDLGTYNKYSPANIQKVIGNGNLTPINPFKYEKTGRVNDYTYKGATNLDEGQHPSMSNFSSNYLPITLIKDENSSLEKSGERKQSYSGLKIIEDRIKRIKEQKGQVVSPLNDTKERLYMASPKRQQATPKPGAKESEVGILFELKVFPVNNDRPETVKIAEKLCFQIEIDIRMKKAKDAFYNVQGQEKWKELSEKLAKLNVRMSPSELKDIILPPEGYFKTHPNETRARKVQSFAQQYADSQKFWEKHVIGCANLKNLCNEGFDARSLDINSKGCLKIEDIVNFVNTYTAHTYKDNDLGTVFRRLHILDNGGNPEMVEYSTFMQAFTM